MFFKICVGLLFGILIFSYFFLAEQMLNESGKNLEKQVAEEAEKIKKLSGESESRFNELPNTSFDPILKLQKMGMIVIPFLLPYLSDTSQTQAERVDHRWRPDSVHSRRNVIVNEISVI
uniref:Uncharacterized protein n=1 Tax=Leptospira ellisii TaxID=2023197 RepID=A0A2N0B3G7_9LEPT|nr:hypothetical protein CH379_20840 [Leptospira ellisii]